MSTTYLVSCAHATCAVPEAQRELFRGAEDALASAEGWDPGALNLAQTFAMRLRTPLVHGDVTRLLVDLEKDGDARWSRFSEKLPEHTRGKLAERHSANYRQTLRQRAGNDLERHARVIHLMVRTVAEAAGNVVFAHAAGDPASAELAASWTRLSREKSVDAQEREMAGEALHRAVREGFPPGVFLQVEVRVSQSFFLENVPMRWVTLKKLLADGFEATARGL